MNSGLAAYSLPALILAGLLGLVLGSFANTLAHWLAGGPSPLRRRSACPHCGHALAWRDLVPLASFALARGRCRRCGHRLSWRYPLSEALCALAVLAALHLGGATPWAPAYLVFLLALLLVALVDAESGMVPDVVVFPAACLGLAAAALLPGPGLVASLLAGLLAAGLLWLVAWGFRRARGKAGLGPGDVKLAALMGVFLGIPGVFYAVVAAAGLGLLYYGAAALRGAISWQARVPFAPFLALGSLLVMLLWEPLHITANF